MRQVAAVAVHHADGLPLLAPLREALSGSGPALAPHPAGQAPDAGAVAPLRPDEDETTDPVAAVVATTGSTGRAKQVLLPASALLASAAATHDHVGGAGRWLLAVPAHTVAGLQVLVRSLVAGTRPEVLDLSNGFDVAAFTGAVEELRRGRPGRRYTSLVPTQLHRLLGAPGHLGRRAVEALAGFDAVLVGGAALSEDLRARAEAAQVRVVPTYGMTETCGGCVYDGVPLPGVSVRTDPLPGAAPGEPGRVVLSGAVLARGYRSPAGAAGDGEGFVMEAGRRWFATADRGSWGSGRLTLHGRTDDVVVSGGVNVALDPVTRLVSSLPGVEDCLAVGVPDPSWGHVVGLLLVGRGAPADDVVRAAVRESLGRAAVPRLLLRVPALPITGVGKPDRQAAVRLVTPGGASATGLGDHVPARTAPTEEPTP